MGNRKNHSRKNKRLANNWRNLIKLRYFNLVLGNRLAFKFKLTGKGIKTKR